MVNKNNKIFVDPYLFFDDSFLSDSPVFLEIGSFTGEHAKKLHELYDAKVIVYEASRNNFALLKKSIGSDNIVIHNKAVSGENGFLEFYDFLTPSSNSSFPRHKTEGKKVKDSYKVSSVTLSKAMLENALDKIDVVFFNCEGSELAILDNFFESKDLHDKVAQLSVSFHPQIYGKEAVDTILKKALSNGFKFVVSDKKWPCTLFIKKV
jgi:FkbM family methyltransferase